MDPASELVSIHKQVLRLKLFGHLHGVDLWCLCTGCNHGDGSLMQIVQDIKCVLEIVYTIPFGIFPIFFAQTAHYMVELALMTP